MLGSWNPVNRENYTLEGKQCIWKNLKEIPFVDAALPCFSGWLFWIKTFKFLDYYPTLLLCRDATIWTFVTLWKEVYFCFSDLQQWRWHPAGDSWSLLTNQIFSCVVICILKPIMTVAPTNHLWKPCQTLHSPGQCWSREYQGEWSTYCQNTIHAIGNKIQCWFDSRNVALDAIYA